MEKNEKLNPDRDRAVSQALSDRHFAVAKYLKDLKFKRRLGGVDEADVWKKIERLCQLYEDALEEARGQAPDPPKPRKKKPQSPAPAQPKPVPKPKMNADDEFLEELKRQLDMSPKEDKPHG